MVAMTTLARRLAPTWLRIRSAASVPSVNTATLHTTRTLAARGDGYKGRGRSSSKRDTEEPRPPAAKPVEIDREAEWRRLRARTYPVTRPQDPLDAPIKKALQERARKRRLGLLPEDDDNDQHFAAEYRAQLEEKQQLRAAREKRKAEKIARRDSEEATGKPRRAVRRPVAPSEKMFTGLRSAPDEIVEREFLEPDEPTNPKGLDIAIIGRPNAGKSSIANRLLDVTVRVSNGPLGSS
jgi:hypothetical protein